MNRRTASAFSGAGVLLDSGVRGQLRLAWRLLRDPRVSPPKLVVPLLLLAYIASPVDVVPDFLLGVGHADDVGVGILLTLLAAKLIPLLAPDDVVEEHLRQTRGQAGSDASHHHAHDEAMNARFTVRD